MFRKIAIFAALFLTLCVFTVPAANAQQQTNEGVLHGLFRAVVAIPYALLGSLRGPETQNAGGWTYASAPTVTYTTAPPYEAVAPTAVITGPPAYITYNSVTVQDPPPSTCPPNTYIYNPLPFQP